VWKEKDLTSKPRLAEPQVTLPGLGHKPGGDREAAYVSARSKQKRSTINPYILCKPGNKKVQRIFPSVHCDHSSVSGNAKLSHVHLLLRVRA
jgi:hypothetical protein